MKKKARFGSAKKKKDLLDGYNKAFYEKTKN